tara:strand:+ start:583 stop:1089 length:507 start_codon:yes stop_codon:yes gene_type:complete
MKKVTLLGIFLAVFAISCEGPQGPPGFDGVNIVGATYEIDNVDFAVGTNTIRYTFPQDLANGDAVLVYRLEAVQDGLDIWEPLPTATIFFEGGGFLQYRFNYTIADVDIIIESDDLATIGTEFMLNQVFRIIVVPSDLIGTIDTSNIDNVLNLIGQNNIQTIDFNTIN